METWRDIRGNPAFGTSQIEHGLDGPIRDPGASLTYVSLPGRYVNQYILGSELGIAADLVAVEIAGHGRIREDGAGLF